MITLNDDQSRAAKLIAAWVKDPTEMEFRLAGYAGTGKTTLIKWLTSKGGLLHDAAVAAFTGKAVNVLKTKGVTNAQTLHQLLYVSLHMDVLKEKCEECAGPCEHDIYGKRFGNRPRDLEDTKYVIVDEASMLSVELYERIEELEANGIKVLLIGDPSQLEPVGSDPQLMMQVDCLLNQIVRQSAGSPILSLAHHVRSGGAINAGILGEWDKGELGALRVVDTVPDDIVPYDVILCASNKTRHKYNRLKRRQLGYTGAPQPGETVICLENNEQHNVYNGVTMRLARVHKGQEWFLEGAGFYADLEDADGALHKRVPLLLEYFGKNYNESTEGSATQLDDPDREHGIPFDFGYCLTTHKAQGSEWDRVLMVDEPFPKVDRRRMRYTMITRARRELTVYRPAPQFLVA